MNIVTLKIGRQRGFSLVELAVVLVILGFVLAALLLPLQAQRENTFRAQTDSQLEIAKKALIGFAQTNGRLPCPATAASGGLEAPVGGGTCTNQLGYLPAAILGLQPTNEDGLAIDGWNNPIFYGVTQANTPGGAVTPDFTTVNEMNVVGIANLAPDLVVCPQAVNCPATYLIDNAVAVIYSLGPTGALASQGADEDENPTAPGADTQFVSQSATSTFDHLVVWISPYVLYNAMIQAGQLH